VRGEPVGSPLTESDCLICQELASEVDLPGGLLAEGELVAAFHRAGTSTSFRIFAVFPRYPGTPAELDWMSADEWEGAPRGDAAEIAGLVDRLRAAIQASPA
jgi:hypothetical protein